jgi:hypothetical protein
MNSKKNNFIPNSLAGKWSVGLGGLCFLFLIMFGLQRSGSIQIQVDLAISILGAVITGILSFIPGIFAIFKKKDRSVLVLLFCGIGSFVSGLAMLIIIVSLLKLVFQ